MDILGVIPARYNSSRFRGKPLADISGKPMIWWVYEQAKKTQLLTRVVVATDSNEIYNKCVQLGMNVIMTKEEHPTGTDRIGEVMEKVPADLYVNIQGDEPLIEPSTIDAAIYPILESDNIMVTNLMTKIINPVDLINPTIPKVITTSDNRGLFLSRGITPFPKGSLDYDYFKQVCVYAFRPESLDLFCKSKRTKNEIIEDIEILRLIELGLHVQFIEVESDTIAVDTPLDLEKVREIFRSKGGGS